MSLSGVWGNILKVVLQENFPPKFLECFINSLFASHFKVRNEF